MPSSRIHTCPPVGTVAPKSEKLHSRCSHSVLGSAKGSDPELRPWRESPALRLLEGSVSLSLVEVKGFQPGILNAAEEALGATHIEGWGRRGTKRLEPVFPVGLGCPDL